MKITVHLADANVGYACPRFVGTDLKKLEAEIAEVCRKSWATATWETDKAPPIPSVDRHVIEAYFYGWEDGEDGGPGPIIHWNSYEVDVPVASEPIDIQGLRVTQYAPERDTRKMLAGGAIMEGALEGVEGEARDVLESFILSLAAAGLPVYTREFYDALTTTIDAIGNHMGEA